jgi:hypothetical protein
MDVLLAVDVGLRTGLALYGRDGRLRWYCSHNFGTPGRLRRAVRGLLDSQPELVWLVLEGGGPLTETWKREAARRRIAVRQISAEAWRQPLLHPRQQRTGAHAKANAVDVARRVVIWSEAPRPTAMRDDTAEAILIGLWGVLEVGWLTHLPELMRG